MRRSCRIWWPKKLTKAEPCSYSFLFGWFITCSPDSLDIVVALASDEPPLSRYRQSGLEDILHEINRNTPTFLLDKSMFSLLGISAIFPICNGHSSGAGITVGGSSVVHESASAFSKNYPHRENYGGWKCGCQKPDGLVEVFRQHSLGNKCWIQLIYSSHGNYKEIRWVPKLHHIHWNGAAITQSDVHVIVYETPAFGVQYYSLGIRDPSEQVKGPVKKPKWIDELRQKNPLNDLDSVVMAINCVSVAKETFEASVGNKTLYARNPIFQKCLASLWLSLAIFIASLSTIFYIVIQFFHWCLSSEWIYLTSARIFKVTWTNMHIRCCQILYWPIILGQKNIRSMWCVQYMESAVLHKHSMWSSIAFDVILGNFIGMTLFVNANYASLWVLNFANDFTNLLLRSGCVWLMGVPAGFKLNTELAGLLGMISLNAIQIWSTLWVFVAPLFIYFVKGLAVLGILFGVSIPAALIIDTIMVMTLHVSALHWWISLLYSHQIHALAALWRLFRGQKWNPLRQRLDSYDYTVKQHIMGSLLFTPLLLLLPTSSVFYIFFTILKTFINFTCMTIEALICIIHGTPHIELFLWLVNKKRFPLGLWFETLSPQSDRFDSPEVLPVSSSNDSQQHEYMKRKKSTFLVSVLHSNYSRIGQVLMPHYKKIFSSVSGSFMRDLAHGVLTGKRIPSSLGMGYPSTMPWMFITFKEYWCLCYNSVLSCMKEYDKHNLLF